jgi:hypothetical protein
MIRTFCAAVMRTAIGIVDVGALLATLPHTTVNLNDAQDAVDSDS